MEAINGKCSAVTCSVFPCRTFSPPLSTSCTRPVMIVVLMAKATSNESYSLKVIVSSFARSKQCTKSWMWRVIEAARPGYHLSEMPYCSQSSS